MYAASLLILHIVLSGVLVSLPLCRSIGKKEKIPVFTLLGMSLLAGMLINMILMLSIQSLSASFMTGLVIDFAGLSLLFLHGDAIQVPDFSRKTLNTQVSEKALVFLLCLAVSAYVIYSSLLQPVVAWDARSIWFFHGKIIYYSGGIYSDSGWNNLFSHPEYPKLIPLLAAQIAHIAGYWNEYLPLTCISILLCMEFLLLAYVVESLLFVTLLLLLLARSIGLSDYLSNGYVDMHLALIAMLAAGLFIKSFINQNKLDCLLGIFALGIAAFLKNEGIVLALIIAFVAGAFFIINSYSRNRIDLLKTVKAAAMQPGFLIALGIAALPTILWQIMCWRWNLKNDLVSASGSLDRIALRMDMGTITTIIRAIDVRMTFALSLATALLTLLIKGRKQVIFYMPLVCCALYLGVLLLTYLSTPYDLAWHLGTSAERVGYPIKFILLFSLALYLDFIFKHLLAFLRHRKPETSPR